MALKRYRNGWRKTTPIRVERGGGCHNSLSAVALTYGGTLPFLPTPNFTQPHTHWGRGFRPAPAQSHRPLSSPVPEMVKYLRPSWPSVGSESFNNKLQKKLDGSAQRGGVGWGGCRHDWSPLAFSVPSAIRFCGG